jgi:hypothetical protein
MMQKYMNLSKMKKVHGKVLRKLFGDGMRIRMRIRDMRISTLSHVTRRDGSPHLSSPSGPVQTCTRVQTLGLTGSPKRPPASEYFARTSRVLFFFSPSKHSINTPNMECRGRNAFSISAGGCACCCASLCGTRLSRVSHGARNDWTRPAPSRGTCVLRALFTLGRFYLPSMYHAMGEQPHKLRGGGCCMGAEFFFTCSHHLRCRYSIYKTRLRGDCTSNVLHPTGAAGFTLVAYTLSAG